ncbi:MAG: hypothetical protein R3C03_10900 [Pirellulaceae bacterium]
MTRNLISSAAMVLVMSLLTVPVITCKPICAQEIDGTIDDLARQSDVEFAHRLLGEWWTRSPENRMAADEEFEKRKSLKSVPGWIQRLYAWHRLEQGVSREAEQEFGNLKSQELAQFEDLLALTWLQFQLKKFDQGLVNLQTMRQEMDKLAAGDVRRTLALSHFGRLIGFAEGPVRDRVQPDVLKLTLEVITKGMTEDELQEFNQSRDALLNDFGVNANNRDSAVANFEMEEQNRRESEAIRVENDNLRMEGRISQIPAEIQQANESFNTQSSALNAQLQPLLATVSTLQSQINGLSIDLQQVFNQIAINQSLLNNRQRNRNDFFIRSEINRLNLVAQDIDFQIGATNSQLRVAQTQVSQLNGQLNQLRNAHASQVSTLEREATSLRNQIGRNLKRLERDMKSPIRVTGAANRMKQEIDALPTYYELPMEQYRQLLKQQIPAESE